jgi:pimeloyl-ACP methyl ester carboxylesterase
MIAFVLAASTLLVPPAPRPVPAVVLLPGAVSADRDGTVGVNRPFADLAEGLAERGIASIRFEGAASDDDARVVAVREIAAAKGVDPERVFLVGHAEGAAIAPRLAKRAGSVRGLVLLAPAVRPVDARMLDQVAYGAKLVGLEPADVAEQSALLEGQFAAIKNPASGVDPGLLGHPAAYWRDVLSIDLPRAIRSTKLPVLVLHGEKDFEVRKDLDFDVLRALLGEAKGRIAYRSFPGLNHLFMRVEGMSSGAEYGVPGHVDREVIGAIADWILAR